MIGKLKLVPLREIWKREEKDFSVWLEENIDVLSDELGIRLTINKRERKAGIFSVDIEAEDEDGDLVVIENQLEKTDHDHLGKIITYMSNLDAKTAIWITSNPRQEHIKAVNWLNESTPADLLFYLVKVEAYRIGESEPAPRFLVVCGPSEESKEISEKKGEEAERHRLRYAFWKQLLERSKKKTQLHANITPCKYSWIGTGAGRSGLSYNYAITYDLGAVELYIDKGKDEEGRDLKDLNKKIFDQLYSKKRIIEKEFGEKLEWQRLDNRRASRIRKTFKGIGLGDQEKWEELQDKMIDAMIRLEKSLRKHITALKI